MKRNLGTIVLLAVTALVLSSFRATMAQAGHYVYTNDNGSLNTVTTFSVDSKGNLTNLGQTPTGGSGCGGTSTFYASRRARISHNGDYLLVTNDCGGNTVSVFSGATAGKLVLIGMVPFPTASQGASIASDGKCLVFGSGTTISSFLFPSFTPVNSVTVDSDVDDMKIGKPGPDRYVAAALPDSQEVVAIPLSPNSCMLGEVAMIHTSGFLPAGVDFSPRSGILYVGDANKIGTIVEAFAFPAGTPLTGSPYTYSAPRASVNSNTVLVSKDGQCLFVANQFSSSVTSVPLSDGIPGTMATAFPESGEPAGMANDITGKMFYVASNRPNDVTTEIIGSGCALTEGLTALWPQALPQDCWSRSLPRRNVCPRLLQFPALGPLAVMLPPLFSQTRAFRRCGA